jgi:dTDP-4-dehydrorhamnose 3,5-epimerase
VKIVPTVLPGVLIVEPDVFGDERGFFLETWSETRYREAGIDARIVQTNHSLSGARILRGLHAQLAPRAQGKIVRVVEGAVLDVAVDIRRGSPSFGRCAAVELSAANFRQMWVPPGFAHGFAVLGERAQVEYACTQAYAPEHEIAIAWNDPAIAVPWPFTDPVLSQRDAGAPPLAAWEGRLPQFRP